MIRREYRQLAGAKNLSRADFLATKYGLSRRGILYIVHPECGRSGKTVAR